MDKSVSYSFKEETPEAKALWFQSLTLLERMDLLCSYTDLILENNPRIVEKKGVKSITKRVQVLEKT